jgi:hypothetical protein
METVNHTPWDLATVCAFPKLGSMINNWRKRTVYLYAHPTDQAALVSVGESFDGTLRVMAVEPRSSFPTALAYAARGEVYTYD